jgi:hypothetical protein
MAQAQREMRARPPVREGPSGAARVDPKGASGSETPIDDDPVRFRRDAEPRRGTLAAAWERHEMTKAPATVRLESIGSPIGDLPVATAGEAVCAIAFEGGEEETQKYRARRYGECVQVRERVPAIVG